MHPALVRHFLYPALRATRRDKVFNYLSEMRRVQRLSPDEIRDYQWKKLRKLLEYAAEHVPYYRKYFKNLGMAAEDIRSPDDLNSWPVLRKQDIKENLEDLISEVYPRKNLEPDETGGSTGQNLFFYADRESSDARKANNVRMNEWSGIAIGDKIAFLWGVRFRQSRKERITRAIKNWLSNSLVLSAYKMDEQTVRHYVKQLSVFGPAMLVGYPSALCHVSEMIERQGLKDFHPKVILSSGETLYEWQRQSIEGVMKAQVYNHYGCCEVGAVARECSRRDGLHIACERVLVEVLPVAAAPSGEDLCQLVMTDLDNYGMPFIRYAIEDLGTVTWERCGCGLPLPRLKSLAGRVYDVVSAPNGNYLGGTFWGHILKEGVDKFQVVQETPDEVTIYIVPAGGFSEAVKKQVVRRVAEACGADMKVRFEIRKGLETTPTGKHRYVISKIGLGGRRKPSV